MISIQKVKVKKRNILREKLEKWNLIQVNKVGTTRKYVLQNPVTEIIDGETLAKVATSKGKHAFIILL